MLATMYDLLPANPVDRIAAVLITLVALALGFLAIRWAIGRIALGAIAIAADAFEKGPVATVAYFAAWVFLFPLMVLVSFGLGLVSYMTIEAEHRREERIEKWREKNLTGK